MFEKILKQRMVITSLFLALCMVALTLIGFQTAAAFAGPPGPDNPTDPPPATLIGSIALQGRALGNLVIAVTVSLSPIDNTNPEYSFDLLTDANGVFTIPDIEPGEYDIRIKGINTLRNLAQGVKLKPNDNNYYFFGTLLAGDVETDETFNQITFGDDTVISDYGTFGAYINDSTKGKCTGQTGFDPFFDLNADGCVDLNDLSILLFNIPLGEEQISGDIIENAVPIKNLSLPGPPQAQGGDVLLAFSPDELEVEVGQTVTTPLQVSACCDLKINIVEFTLGFSQTLININDVTPTVQLPIIFSKTVNNNEGSVYYVALKPGYFTNTITAALLSLNATIDTNGTVITPTNFNVYGSDLGSASTEAQSMTVKTQAKDVCGGGYCYYLPLIFKN